jgi:hypothetical protein
MSSSEGKEMDPPTSREERQKAGSSERDRKRTLKHGPASRQLT